MYFVNEDKNEITLLMVKETMALWFLEKKWLKTQSFLLGKQHLTPPR